MSINNSIDEFIKVKVLPECLDIVDSFRKIIKTKFPDIQEEMRGGTEKYYGIPVYRKRKIIISLSPTKKGITFSFTEGKKFDDIYKKLEGEGNKSLNLRVSSIDDFHEEEIVYYIEQAIRFDD
ncbi:DUF1801 domain-containing protein [Myxococcota bacterium]|nr:DUF1801 domain-containing protein [Myxococcota bacterium]MBU1379332.1 DUF1801 domain-containing protein [Myxococcota bacterium]MBU1496030.1 DUF1801 domain-containing protein [Myxococcota bacterium]